MASFFFSYPIYLFLPLSRDLDVTFSFLPHTVVGLYLHSSDKRRSDAHPYGEDGSRGDDYSF